MTSPRDNASSYGDKAVERDDPSSRLDAFIESNDEDRIEVVCLTCPSYEFEYLPKKVYASKTYQSSGAKKCPMPHRLPDLSKAMPRC